LIVCRVRAISVFVVYLDVMMKPQFLIAAPHSGAGKTTVTLGIIRALTSRGLRVQPYKCGPDYLDPKLHTLAAALQSINLDCFMMNDDHIKSQYRSYGAAADVLVTEGVMGLFDGAVKMEGSSADLARLLNIPVILVINAKAMAYSAAALLLGFKMLCPELQIAGVIFNFVAHDSHYQILKAAAEDVGISPLGFLPMHPKMQIPSRHLGLKTGREINHEEIIDQAATHISKHIDLDGLLRITTTALAATVKTGYSSSHVPKRVLIAKDEAFSFTYAENIAALSSIGEISYFSPLTDTQLPETDLIYFPGGYPELHLKNLSGNKQLIRQLKAYHEKGGKILAECGGMMYLGNEIADEDGQVYPMLGILDITTGMQHKRLSLGYKRLNIEGVELRGHEFHYSQFVGSPEGKSGVKVWNARNEALDLPVFKTNNILASYFHFYFGNNIEAIRQLLFD